MAAQSTCGSRTNEVYIRVIVLSLAVIQILAVFCALAQPAYAYVDPGSGLFTLQVISTTFAGIIFFIRRKVRCLFGTRHAGPKRENVIMK